MPKPSFRHLPALLLAWLPAVVVLLPVAVVAWRAAEPAGEMWQHIAGTRLPGYLLHSSILIVAVTALAVLFGVPAAWQVSVKEFPGRRILEWALLLPLAMPGFVAAVAYTDVLGGLTPLYAWIRKTHGIDAFLTTQQIVPWIFATGVLASTLFPYVFLTCRAVFLREAAGSLEAARMLGAGPMRVFCSVAMPMARPAIAAGGSLVAMESMNDFGVVSAFGISPLTPGIFRAWSEGHPGVAMRLAMLLMVFTLFFVSVERWQRGKRKFAPDPSERPLMRQKCGPAGIAVAWTLCLTPLALGFLIPGWRMARWAVGAYRSIDWTGTLDAAWHSISLSAGVALLVTLGAVVLVTGHRAYQKRSMLLAQRAGLLGYTFPSALVAVGVGAIISALSARPGLETFALSASVMGLMTACFVRFLAVGIQPIAAALETVSGSLHQAARTLGASPWRSLAEIDLPLIRPALISAATLAFIDVFKELTMTSVLRPFGYETLATLTYRLTGESRIPEASVPGLLMVLVCLIGLIPLTRLMRSR